MNLSIVDDCEVTLGILNEMCKNDFNVSLYSNPIKAINEIKDVDVLICDYMMFDQDGISVIKKLRSDGINCKMILMSAFDADFIVEECKKENVSDISYISKPFSFLEIQKLLKN